MNICTAEYKDQYHILLIVCKSNK